MLNFNLIINFYYHFILFFVYLLNSLLCINLYILTFFHLSIYLLIFLKSTATQINKNKNKNYKPSKLQTKEEHSKHFSSKYSNKKYTKKTPVSSALPLCQKQLFWTVKKFTTFRVDSAAQNARRCLTALMCCYYSLLGSYLWLLVFFFIYFCVTFTPSATDPVSSFQV